MDLHDRGQDFFEWFQIALAAVRSGGSHRVSMIRRTWRISRRPLKGGHTRRDLGTRCLLFHVDGAAVAIRG